MVRNLSWSIAVIMYVVGNIIEYISKQDEINNLQGAEMFAYEIGVYKFHTPEIAFIFIVLAISVFILGCIISGILCRCNNCGSGVMTRYGSIYEYCPKCGRKVE